MNVMNVKHMLNVFPLIKYQRICDVVIIAPGVVVAVLSVKIGDIRAF